MVGVTMPFEGLAPGWQALFYVALIVIVSMLAWTTLLFVRGLRARKQAPDADELTADEFTWVFLVPALNEEVTIRDSVMRLVEMPLRDKHVVVIDDGSEDGTAEVLAQIEHHDLKVMRRVPPLAREGKAAALNYAYAHLTSIIGDTDRSRVIVTIVDADGRLHQDAPRWASAHLLDPEVGGVQALVRIYNRNHLLTWFQDVEFGVYGNLFQAGRNDWGTAGMGGNGQFNRLSALDDIATHEGPWRDRLTEDQDLGLRLIAAGWLGRQELRATVDQQGLPSLRRLLRQRTRWAQGNLQASRLIGGVWRAPRPLIARFEAVIYILMPLWQTVVGLSLAGAFYLLFTGQATVWHGDDWVQLGFFYLLAFGGTMMGAIASRAYRGPIGWIQGILIGQVYAFYTWLIWPVLVRSVFRQVTERREWAKTDREPLELSAARNQAATGTE
jgi:cellulose synthase/poly-beta-1,6-N-acetylglucosamine synthase-like glycosyltransferase